MGTLVNIFHVNFLGYANWFVSIIISKMKDHSISVVQDIYATSVVAKYLDTTTVKASTKLYKNNLPYDMIFAKVDIYTSDEQVEKLTREFNIHYRAFIFLLIYLLSKRVDLSFSVKNLAMFSSNPGKVHFEGLVHLLRYIRDNNTSVLKYYANINDALVSYLLRQASIKTENHLITFSGSSCKYCPGTGISTGSYIIFYQGGAYDHGTHVTGPVSQSSA